MTAMPISGAKTRRSFVVERPRASDAIGGALRDAFAGECGLPTDMQLLLQKIDRSLHR